MGTYPHTYTHLSTHIPHLKHYHHHRHHITHICDIPINIVKCRVKYKKKKNTKKIRATKNQQEVRQQRKTFNHPTHKSTKLLSIKSARVAANVDSEFFVKLWQIKVITNKRGVCGVKFQLVSSLQKRETLSLTFRMAC